MRNTEDLREGAHKLPLLSQLGSKTGRGGGGEGIGDR